MRKCPPQTLLFGRNEWQCYDYGTLLILKPTNLQTRACRLRDLVGAERCPKPLRTTAPNDVIALWVAETQAHAATASGVHCSASDYGAPAAPPPQPRISESEERRIHDESKALTFVPVDASSIDDVRASLSKMGRGGPLEAPAVSSMQSQFSFGRAYTLAAADSSAASIENKRRNRAGALNEFLFRDADGVTPEPPAVPYMANPPFQIAPPDFRLGTAGSIYATSFQPPPPGFERASPSWYREQPQDSDRKHPSVGAPSNARAMKPPAPAIKARVGPPPHTG